MILSDKDIKKAIQDKQIVIKPSPGEDQFSSTALDLRVNDDFLKWDDNLVRQPGVIATIDFSKIEFDKLATAYMKRLPRETNGSFILRPGDFVLVTTYEHVYLPLSSKIAARIEGRSTAARLGFSVHISAPTIHAGWKGNITLEIVNHGPFVISIDPRKDRICQLIFERVSSIPSIGNQTKFQGQRSPTGRS